MNKLIILISLFLIVSISCSKDDNFTNATIIGYDLRLCACCGGLLVEIASSSQNTFQWYQKHNNFSITGNDNFPIKVKIKFHHLAESCVSSDGEIEITELIKI